MIQWVRQKTAPIFLTRRGSKYSEIIHVYRLFWSLMYSGFMSIVHVAGMAVLSDHDLIWSFTTYKRSRNLKIPHGYQFMCHLLTNQVCHKKLAISPNELGPRCRCSPTLSLSAPPLWLLQEVRFPVFDF